MNPSELKLVPLTSKGHVSVARLTQFWYPVCFARELKKGPLARRLFGTPLVLFRDAAGKPATLLDRCPHRNVPLSLGRVGEQGRLTCRYHGWQFEGSGACGLVPGLLDRSEAKARRVPSFATLEQDGLIWVYAMPDQEPRTSPFAFPSFTEGGYAHVRRAVEAEGTLHATLENALDVPHTAFLHRGLFRGGEPHKILAHVRRTPERVEIEYSGEPKPTGLVAQLLSPSGGVVQHWDRFILPSVAQVEYRLGTENHFLVTAVGSPIDDFHTRLFATASFRTRVPARLLRPILEPFALRIFGQDAAILKAQSAVIREFSGEQFMSTAIDLMGPQMWRLMRQAERGERAEVEDQAILHQVEFLA
ncbi:MAG: aromatic ring-hydroxylating dioxygenase subunit alpha [Polyangiaceae bacterium]|nr:aromatic ring-hydroxylating dioxygenase subunit alpha [Polyangiaceae bacterium]